MKQRNSTIELLRIIAMMGVVALHYLGEGGIVDSYSFPNFTLFRFSIDKLLNHIPALNKDLIM